MESVERASVTNFLDAVLTSDSFETGTPTSAAVSGAPGMGKSSAVAAWTRLNQQRYTVSIWITASNTAAIVAQIRSLLLAYGDLSESVTDTAQIQQAFRHFMTGLPFPWLIVLDGIEDPTTCEGWIPRSGYGHIVFTTIDTTWPTVLSPSIELEPFDGEEARKLLLLSLGAWPTTASSHDLDRIDALTQELDGWPLAMVTVGAWLRDSRGGVNGIDQYLTELADLDLDSPLFQPYGYRRTAVAAVVDALTDIASVGAAQESHAQSLLLAVAHLGSVDVPVRMAKHHAGTPDQPLSDGQVDAAVKLLRRRGLITRRSLAPTTDVLFSDRLSVHTVIGRIARSLQTLDRFRSATCHAADLLETAIRVSWEEQIFTTAFSLLPPATRVLEETLRPTLVGDSDEILISMDALALMGNVAKLEMLQGRAEKAVHWLESEIEVLDFLVGTAGEDGMSINLKMVSRNQMIAYADLLYAADAARKVSHLPDIFERSVSALQLAARVGVDPSEVRDMTVVLLQAIDGISFSATDRERLVNQVLTCRAQGTGSERGRVVELLHRADTIAVDQPTEALRTAREARKIATHPLDRAHARFLEAETLALTGQPELASAGVDQAFRDLLESGLSVEAFFKDALQVSHALAVRLLTDPRHTETADALKSVLSMIGDSIATANLETQARYFTQNAVLSSLMSAPASPDLRRRAQASIDAADSAGQITPPMLQALTRMLNFAEDPPDPPIWHEVVESGAAQLVIGNLSEEGVDTNFYFCDPPAVAFRQPNPPMLHRGGAPIDALRDQLHMNGLPQWHEPGRVPTLSTWNAILDSAHLVVNDSSEYPCLTFPTAEIPEGWIRAALRARSIWLIYGGHTTADAVAIKDGTLTDSNAYIPLKVNRLHRNGLREWFARYLRAAQ